MIVTFFLHFDEIKEPKESANLSLKAFGTYGGFDGSGNEKHWLLQTLRPFCRGNKCQQAHFLTLSQLGSPSCPN